MDVRLQGLSKTYDGRAWALRDLDLEIPTGSIFGLIGPNGAGKSTALRMLATLMEPSRGSIYYDGALANEPQMRQAIRPRIGFLGDGNPLYKHMTPAEYLRFFGQCFGMRGRALEDAITNVLETFSLQAKADEVCGALSKGMRQRLLIGRCLLHDPALLILDEPADGLDPRGRNDLRRILGAARARGVTVVISSHILRELDDLCDRVAILQRGQLVAAGDVGDVIDRYEVSRFVYELRLLDGAEQARELLARRRALIEAEGTADGLTSLQVRIQGDETMMAELLAELVGAGVKIVTCSRVRSRLEDVYDRISDDQVN
jgi:ABC-2 type transport system ATP-binding protein